jgi:2-oxoglutarate ferredoxin oxidoreductase subunit alpha
MMDLDLGMNNWMSEGFKYPEKPVDRGKMLTPEILQKLGEWGRYKDVDGDGIPYRTIPGDGMPSYFTRGSGHNAKGQYSERPDDYVDNMDRLARKFETARGWVPKPVIDVVAGTSYYRLRAYPFTADLAPFIDAHDRIYVIEQNRDAQMLHLMRLELTPERIAKLRSVLHYNGLPIDARSITDDVLAQEGYEVAKKTATRSVASSSGMTGGE